MCPNHSLTTGLFVAIVTKVTPRDNKGARLKAAAQFADSGELRDLVSGLWKAENEEKPALIDKVTWIYLYEPAFESKLTSSGNEYSP